MRDACQVARQPIHLYPSVQGLQPLPQFTGSPVIPASAAVHTMLGSGGADHARAHFDCFSGISGDMTLGALIDAGVDAEAVRDGHRLARACRSRLKIEKVRKGGFAATYVQVEAPDEHKHRHLHHVEEILSRGSLTPRQRELALRIFRRLAEAEAAVHGMPIEKVHFHEVGALDSIADIAGAAVAPRPARRRALHQPAGADRVAARCKCAHGVMPVPAPGTAELLKGVPLAPSHDRGRADDADRGRHPDDRGAGMDRRRRP